MLTSSHSVLRLTGTLAIVLLVAQGTVPAHAATTMTLQTDAPSYSGAQTITITGGVSPAPGPNTGVIVTTRNSAGQGVDIGDVAANPSDGSFTYQLVTGGTSAWTAGTFSVNATWGSSQGSASQVVTFVYSPTATTTSASTTSTITISTTSSTTTTTTTTSTTTTLSTTLPANTSTTAAPEFPSAALAAVALVAVAMVAVLSRKVAIRPGGPMGRSAS